MDKDRLKYFNGIKSKLSTYQYTDYLVGQILKYSNLLICEGHRLCDVRALGEYQEMLYKHLEEMEEIVYRR